MTERCIVIGDFNLDYFKVFDVSYGYKGLFKDFDIALPNFELVQLSIMPMQFCYFDKDNIV